VAVGEAPVVKIDEGDADDVQTATKSSIVWAAMSIVSSGDAERRLEVILRRCASA
jgi:hypothetical protein